MICVCSNTFDFSLTAPISLPLIIIPDFIRLLLIYMIRSLFPATFYRQIMKMTKKYQFYQQPYLSLASQFDKMGFIFTMDANNWSF